MTNRIGPWHVALRLAADWLEEDAQRCRNEARAILAAMRADSGRSTKHFGIGVALLVAAQLEARARTAREEADSP